MSHWPSVPGVLSSYPPKAHGPKRDAEELQGDAALAYSPSCTFYPSLCLPISSTMHVSTVCLLVAPLVTVTLQSQAKSLRDLRPVRAPEVLFAWPSYLWICPATSTQPGQVGLVAMVGNPSRKGTTPITNLGRWDSLAMVGNPLRPFAETRGCLQEGHPRQK